MRLIVILALSSFPCVLENTIKCVLVNIILLCANNFIDEKERSHLISTHTINFLEILRYFHFLLSLVIDICIRDILLSNYLSSKHMFG